MSGLLFKLGYLQWREGGKSIESFGNKICQSHKGRFFMKGGLSPSKYP